MYEGRPAPWAIENEGTNCLVRHGYNSKRNFGHGSEGLANLPATLNLFALALDAVLDGVSDLWRQCRDRAGIRRGFSRRCASSRSGTASRAGWVCSKPC